MNWCQNSTLLCWWPVIAISDWSPFQVRFRIDKIYSHQSFALCRYRSSCCCRRSLRESYPSAHFRLKLHFIFPKTAPSPNANYIFFTMRCFVYIYFSCSSLAVYWLSFAWPTLPHFRLKLIASSIYNLCTAKTFSRFDFRIALCAFFPRLSYGDHTSTSGTPLSSLSALYVVTLESPDLLPFSFRLDYIAPFSYNKVSLHL